MKIIILFAVLVLSACNREKCWRCTTEIEMTDIDTIRGVVNKVADSENDYQRCDLTRAEKVAEEKRNTRSQADKSITGRLETEYRTTCR